MQFVQLSSDLLTIHREGHVVTVDRGQLEKELPAVLNEQIEAGENSFLVVNGPGGFTSLRTGCLTLNLLQMLHSQELHFFDISKIAVYKVLVTQGVLPSLGVIYIGQKKNVWVYDFSTDSYQKVSIEDLQTDLEGDYFIDQVTEHRLVEAYNKDIIVDWGYDPAGVQIARQGDEHHLTVSDLELAPTHYLQPNYMMQPTIGTGT